LSTNAKKHNSHMLSARKRARYKKELVTHLLKNNAVRMG